VADFLQEQLLNNALLFEIRDLELRLDCDPDLCGYFDPTLVAGVLNNVLVNAARYARRLVSIDARATSEGLLIEVLDDGDGFPQKMRQQCSGNRDRGIDFQSGSTNLGLFFAGEVAALHRRGAQAGSIALRNRPEGGGCFQLL